MPNGTPNVKTPLKEMSPNQHESISGSVRERLKKNGMKLVKKEPLCQEWDLNPRLHAETRTLVTIQTVKEFHLESGALDRSAILTAHKLSLNV